MRRHLSILVSLSLLVSVAVLAAVSRSPRSGPADRASSPGATNAAAAARGPIRAVFYYPWFPETWHSNDQYRPRLGRYSSDDRAVLRKHFRSMRYAGVDAAISSWWGRDTPTGKRLPPILRVAAKYGRTVAPYYERECCNSDPSMSEVRSDLDHLAPLTSRPGWLHVDGKPVIFVYNAGRTGCSDVTKWRRATREWSDYYVQMKVFPGFEACADQPDSWHQYGPAKRRSVHLPWSHNVSPGFWHHEEPTPRLERSLTKFKRALRAQTRSGAKWQLVTSFSEWGEGTSVEAAREWRSSTRHGQYLDAMRRIYRRADARSAITNVSATGADLAHRPAMLTVVTGAEEKQAAVRERLFPVADAFVTAGMPGRNFGKRTVLRADGSPVTRSYLKFRVPEAPSRAILKVWSRANHKAGFRVSSTRTTWTEQNITYDNAPPVRSIRASSGALAPGQWVNLDVSDAVTTAGDVSFALETDSSRAVVVASRESTKSPRLVVSYADRGTVVWAAGDLCDNDNEPVDCADVGRLISRDRRAEAFLALGDLQYDKGELSDFRQYYNKKMGAKVGLKSMTYPAIGNHETDTRDAAGYFDYWGDQAGPRPKGYYATDLGPWRLVVTNSNCSDVGGCKGKAPQARFVRRELRRTDRCAVVITHHPAITDGNYSPGDEDGKELFDLAVDGGAELFLSGHDHEYQRFAPRDKALKVDRRNGVRQFVVGTGGKGLTDFRSANRSEYRQNRQFGALRLNLRENGYTFRFISIHGRTMDRGTGTCH